MNKAGIWLLVCLSHGLFGQDTNSPPNSYEPIPRYVVRKDKLLTSSKSFSPKEKYKPKKGSFNWKLDQQVIEFEKRMKTVAKKYRKEARMERKPRYSDPLYFGHKRKPKKRPVGKRKLCRECRIVH